MNAGAVPVVLVAGAATPAGRSISEALADVGAQLLLTDVVESHLVEVAENIAVRSGARPATRLLRVTDPRAWGVAVDVAEQMFGRLDLVVNAAEYDPGVPWRQATADDWSRATGINLAGVTHGLAATLPALRRSAGCFAVVMGNPAPVSGHVLRTTARSAAMVFAQAVRAELAPDVSVATVSVDAGEERGAGARIVAALCRGATEITVRSPSV